MRKNEERQKVRLEEGERRGGGIARGASEKNFLSHARNRGTNKILN